MNINAPPGPVRGAGFCALWTRVLYFLTITGEADGREPAAPTTNLNEDVAVSHMTSLKIVSVLLLGVFAAFAAVLPAAAQGKAASDKAAAPAAAQDKAASDKAAAPAAAQDNKAAAASGATQYKIGVVDMSVLLSDYKKRKVLYDQLQKEVDEKQKELDAMEAAINKDKASYDSQRDGLSEDARIEMRTKIETAITNYKAAMQTRQRMIDNNEERVMKELVGDIQKTIAKVGESEGYHIILNSAGEGGPRAALLYHSTTVDMTSKVLALLNK